MDKQLPVISGAASLAEIISIFGNTDSFYYPVVDDNKNLIITEVNLLPLF